MKQLGTYLSAFLLGFFLYAMFEIAERGYTHWTMALTGGIAMTMLYSMELRLQISIVEKALLGCLFVTALEFTVGIFDNLIMGWAVWDYTNVRMNLLGQICLPFSVLWFLLCIPAIGICKLLRRNYRSSHSIL